MSVFEQNFNNSNWSKLESKSLEHVRFRIKLLTIRQNLIQNFYNVSNFEGNFFVENQNSLEYSQENNFFGSSHTVKTTQLALSCCLGKLDSDIFVWKKEHFYQSNFSSSFTFWNQTFKTRQILRQDFWACQVLSQLFKFVWTWNEILRTCQIMKFSWKFFKVFGACQVLNLLFNHPSVIESKTSKSNRFCYIFFQKKS